MINKFLKKIIYVLVLVIIITSISSFADNLKYVEIIEETPIYKRINEAPLNSIGLAKKGDVFKCISNDVEYCVIILFSGKGRYVANTKARPISYVFNLPRKEICQEINILIENIKKDSISQAKKNSQKNEYDQIYSQILDQNLLELFHLCKINPCDYTKIIQKASN